MMVFLLGYLSSMSVFVMITSRPPLAVVLSFTSSVDLRRVRPREMAINATKKYKRFVFKSKKKLFQKKNVTVPNVALFVNGSFDRYGHIEHTLAADRVTHRRHAHRDLGEVLKVNHAYHVPVAEHELHIVLDRSLGLRRKGDILVEGGLVYEQHHLLEAILEQLKLGHHTLEHVVRHVLVVLEVLVAAHHLPHAPPVAFHVLHGGCQAIVVGL
jgi:hypothetical protein